MRKRTIGTALAVAMTLLAPLAWPNPPSEGGTDLRVDGGLAAPSAATSATRPILRLGARGPVVRVLQERLRFHGARLTVDERFGPATRKAVMAFQTAKRLTADGIVGAQTWPPLEAGGGRTGPLMPVAFTSAEPWRILGAKSYVVRGGDTLNTIAVATKSTTAALEAANRLAPGARPRTGSTLRVPGSWRCPVPDGIFINDYGFPRENGRTHKGNDLFAPRGAPIQAPVAGRAERQDGGLGGFAINLVGDDGHKYYFAHLDRYGTIGRVAQGATIGYVGNTGNAITTPPHLHFEIHPDGGAATNPFPTVTLACKR